MGKHTTEAQKVEFLTRCEYESIYKAAKKCGIAQSTAKDIFLRAGDRLVDAAIASIPALTLTEQVTRKQGSGRLQVISDEEIIKLFQACTLNKKQQKKLQHQVAAEEGFDGCRRTIETRLRKKGLQRTKSTKKLDLTPIQRAMRYEIALSREHWGLREWSKVIFSDEASIIVSAQRGKQNISRTVDERYHPDCIERRYNNYSEAMFWGMFYVQFQRSLLYLLSGNAYSKEILRKLDRNP